MNSYFDCTLALLALINPISKIFLISTLFDEPEDSLIRHISIKASTIATFILILFAFVGNFLLNKIFHVNIYSFQIIGGLVLTYRGFLALNRGLFFDMETNKKNIEEASVVPIASPMIAGPATITAAVSFPAKYGLFITGLSIALAIFINLIFMLWAKSINDFLSKYNLMGALIRITGLIVATIGAQMILDGLYQYVQMWSCT